MSKRTKSASTPYTEAARELAKKSRTHGRKGAGDRSPPELVTPERLVRAREVGGVVEYDTRRGSETPGQQKLKTAPLDRLHHLCKLAPNDDVENERLYGAGNQYRFDWYLGQMSGHKAPNLAGAGGAGFHPNGPSPFFADSAVTARKRYADARLVLGKHFRELATMVLCDEHDPAEAAKLLTHYSGIKNSEAVGTDRLRITLSILADFYDHYERRGRVA